MSILYKPLVIGANPSAYYRLGEASGLVAADSSGNGLSATITGVGVTYGQTGAIIGDTDKALLFNGTTGDVLAPAGLNTAGYTAITVEAWVKFTNVTFVQNPRLVANSHTDIDFKGFQLAIQAGGSAANFTVGNGVSAAQASGAFTFLAGVYYHIVGTWDGTSVKVYVNGVLKATNTLSGTMGTPSSQVSLAYASTYNGDFLPGTLDEAAIYPTALSVATILEHYNVGNQGNGGGSLSTVTNGGTILANDLNQVIGILQQVAGGQEKGKYFLSGNSYAINAWSSVYIGSLSRGATPVSNTIDTADFAAASYNAPSSNQLTQGGFQVHATGSAIATNCNVAGNYTIQY